MDKRPEIVRSLSLDTGKSQSAGPDAVIGVATDNISHVFESPVLQGSSKAALLEGIQLGVRQGSIPVPIADGEYPT